MSGVCCRSAVAQSSFRAVVSAILHALRGEFIFSECRHLAFLPDAISDAVRRKSGHKRLAVAKPDALGREREA